MTAKFEGALIYDVTLQKDAMNIMDRVYEDVSRKIETKRAVILRIRKQLKKHIRRKEGLKNFIHTGHNEGRNNSWNQPVTHLRSLCEWIVEQGMGGIGKRETLLRSKWIGSSGEPSS